ncbi:MAG TPA: amino acid ABC transporter permease [Rectinemataceae bacterium]|nr:amino acid ABC transporter permease [Rectinemataceae bacterium]
MGDLARLLKDFGPAFINSAAVTWKLTVISYSLGVLLGIVLTVLRVLPIRPLKLLVNAYVEIFRNIPTVALLIIIVFALPDLHILIDYEPSVIVALMLVCSAFTADNLRSGINTVDAGQIEASYSLGMSLLKTMYDIVLPQALRAVVQPMTSLLIGLMLSTAIASQVPVPHRELTGLVDMINNETASGILTFIITAGFYVASGLLISWAGAALDRKVRVLR